jgi:predicted transcriptional regulator
VDRLARLREQNFAEIGLYELRRALDLSQVSLADRLEVTQSAISKLEASDDLLLSTLRGYVEALGGKLVLKAEFANTTIELQVGDRSDATS